MSRRENEEDMAMSELERSECKEIAREIIKEVMAEHVASCPHGQNFNVFRAKVYAFAAGVGIATGSATGVSIAAILKAFAQ